MDLWSFLRNDEVNAIILEGVSRKRWSRMFQADLEQSEEILLTQWKKRPFRDRLRDGSHAWFSIVIDKGEFTTCP